MTTKEEVLRLLSDCGYCSGYVYRILVDGKMTGKFTDFIDRLIELAKQAGADEERQTLNSMILAQDQLGEGAFSNGFRQAVLQIKELLIDRVGNKEVSKIYKDAERYRYLRDTEMWGPIIWEALDFPDDHGGYSEALDSAVDESIRNRERKE